jgi:hypothetical protein
MGSGSWYIGDHGCELLMGPSRHRYRPGREGREIREWTCTRSKRLPRDQSRHNPMDKIIVAVLATSFHLDAHHRLSASRPRRPLPAEAHQAFAPMGFAFSTARFHVELAPMKSGVLVLGRQYSSKSSNFYNPRIIHTTRSFLLSWTDLFLCSLARFPTRFICSTSSYRYAAMSTKVALFLPPSALSSF